MTAWRPWACPEAQAIRKVIQAQVAVLVHTTELAGLAFFE